mmetsp:Transcript_6745/g.29363  ORF Transcript_6745/g.29363 Transcript_6745/m.29363 type:complete len:898 (-) Transcript_6745:744-3437(-)
MQAHAMTLGVHAIGVRTIVNVKARSYGHGGRPAPAFAPRACTHSEPRLGAEATRARAIRARVFARRAREIRPVLGLGDHTGLVHPPRAARGPTAAHAASGGDDDKDADASSSGTPAGASDGDGESDAASTAVSASSSAGAEDDAEGESKDESTETSAIDVSSEAGGPPASKLREADTDENKTDLDKQVVGRPTDFATWFRRLFQPMRLFTMGMNTFLFFFAANLFHNHQDKAPGTHMVPVTYSRFLEDVKNDEVKYLKVDGSYLTWKPKTPYVIKRPGVGPMHMTEEKIEVAYSAARPEDARVPYEHLSKNKVEFGALDKRYQSQRNINTFIAVFVVGMALVQFNRMGQNRGGMGQGGGGMMRGMGGGPNTSAGRMMGGKQRGALPPPSTTFNDVAGVDEAKEELQEIVDILKRPEHYTRLGARPPCGVLLVGAPGTGKTLLARAVAGEAGVPFISVSASEFVELYVGMGAARVRDVFARAREQAPAIVFIDEIDAVGTSRKAFETQSRKTLNQLLTEMDGFEQNEGIIVIAATNIPEQLDPALTRPGRFDRLVHVPNPDIGGRREILTHYLADKPVEPDVDVESLARGTAGFSGAELANLVNMACVQAAVTGETTITSELMEWAKDRVIMGVERKSAVLTEESKRLTAYHEAGHAIVALRTPGAMPVHKATIVPRGSALGMVTQLPDKDETSITRKQLLARLDVCMGGRVAEELIFGRDEVTTGALSDLQQATRLATYMVGEVGLSSLVGPVHVDSMSKGGRRATEALVDKEVVTLLRDSHARVTKLLTKHTGDLHTLSAEMLRRETLTGDEIRAVLGMEPVVKPTPTPKPTQKPNTSGGEKAESEKTESADGDVEKDTEKDGDEAIDMLLPEVVEPVEAVGDKSEAKESEVPTAA